LINEFGERLMRVPRISALSIAILIAGCGQWPAPSDESIIARFASHRTEFNQLLEMFRHDGIFGRFSCDDAPHVPRDAPPVSEERRAEYTKILKAIGSDCAVYCDFGSGRTQFFMWSTGMLFAGRDKSILFNPSREPSPLVDSTDNYRWTQEDHRIGSVTMYRHIDGPWYLMYAAN
jgi:hypothetical protein